MPKQTGPTISGKTCRNQSNKSVVVTCANFQITSPSTSTSESEDRDARNFTQSHTTLSCSREFSMEKFELHLSCLMH